MRPAVAQPPSTRIQRPPKPTDALVPTVGILLLAAFFAAHQVWSTGFFLPSFSAMEAVLLYVSILYGIVVTST